MAFAWLALLLRKQKHASPLESILLGNILAAIICLPFMLQSMPDLKGWIGLLIMGIFQLGLPYLLFSIAIKHVTALESMLIPMIEPILNPIWVLIFLGEVPGMWAVAGGVIVLTAISGRGVYLIMIKRANRERR